MTGSLCVWISVILYVCMYAYMTNMLHKFSVLTSLKGYLPLRHLTDHSLLTLSYLVTAWLARGLERVVHHWHTRRVNLKRGTHRI
jgi:hypothetical protein